MKLYYAENPFFISSVEFNKIKDIHETKMKQNKNTAKQEMKKVKR